MPDPGNTERPVSERTRQSDLAVEELLEDSGGARGLWKPALLAAVLLASLITARFLGVEDRLGEFHRWISGLGNLGIFVFALFCVAWALAMIPATILQVLAGFLFGPWVGTAVYSVAYTTGTVLCFLLARYVARKPVESLASGYPRLKRLMALTGEHEVLVMALSRLMPLSPTNAVNYLMGVTKVRFGVFLFWSFFGMIPITFLVVASGDVLSKGDKGGNDWMVATAAAGTVLLLVVTIWQARRRLASKRRVSGSPPASAA